MILGCITNLLVRLNFLCNLWKRGLRFCSFSFCIFTEKRHKKVYFFQFILFYIAQFAFLANFSGQTLDFGDRGNYISSYAYWDLPMAWCNMHSFVSAVLLLSDFFQTPFPFLYSTRDSKISRQCSMHRRLILLFIKFWG